MPSFTQACFVALAASWSFRELSPDLVQCIPLAWAGYESFSEACSHQPSAPEPAAALRLYVRSSGSLTVAFIVELQKDLVFGLDGAPVARLQPMVAP